MRIPLRPYSPPSALFFLLSPAPSALLTPVAVAGPEHHPPKPPSSNPPARLPSRGPIASVVLVSVNADLLPCNDKSPYDLRVILEARVRPSGTVLHMRYESRKEVSATPWHRDAARAPAHPATNAKRRTTRPSS
ncbi:hypothetical protein D9619_005051 [Psilocybe cf. subviscida]|uniref:Uncharacterized protein n=1 Tax=Psilocybe cf. subviscida TaxID=2480587 RepID=A0A8H5BPA8_9AGAR|nr:hypothetical protein D9619_005051 [Psilocybe cf. subviscida]